MGLTSNSTGIGAYDKELRIERINEDDKVIALAGNPNVGKSTIFNSLTGLNQHTGNWPGKTVTNAQGRYRYKDRNFILIDIPGTYSLMANSVEEEIARDFILFGNPDGTIIVTDATLLERNLNLVLQTLEISESVVVCVNLLDEAKRKKIHVDIDKLSKLLGVPVAGTSANIGEGMEQLMDSVYKLTDGSIKTAPFKVRYDDPVEKAVSLLEPAVGDVLCWKLNSRWVSLKLLDGDINILDSLKKYLGFDLLSNDDIVERLNEAKEILYSEGITGDNFRDRIVSAIYKECETISKQVVKFEKEKYDMTDRKIDRILTSKKYGIPVMILLLGFILWLTITGANYPSEFLASILFRIEEALNEFFISQNTPSWLRGLFVTGIYRTLAWVVSVMLPPMAIFFPLFTLLEDLGYLPRVAFNLDNFFKKACCHGKQALTMCMGFGCNAAGVVGCRIIDSPRERLIAIITNNFIPCNGRFPTLTAIITMFFAGFLTGPSKSIVSTMILTMVILLGIAMTLLISKLLSKTILKGLPSSFTLELPPYRKPQIGKIIVRSIFDRTIFVLGRAVAVAAPAGLIIWVMAKVEVNGLSLLSHFSGFLDPFARLIGLDGVILMAFILGFPANEIVVPIIIMSYLSTGGLMEFENLAELRELLVSKGWSWLTAICFMIFTLMHFPCGTTCWTIKKETGSWKWTAVSILIPTITGTVICFIVASIARLLGVA